MADKSLNAWSTTMTRRLTVTAVAFGLWAAAIQGRLVYLQVFRHADLVGWAKAYQEDRRVIPARRGAILDRNGRPLALSLSAPDINAAPSQMSDPVATADALCAALEPCSPEEHERLRAGFRRQGGYFPVRRQVTQEQADRIKALDLDGIYFEDDSRRVYPNMELAAHVVGFVNRELEGAGGIEYGFEDLIKGRDGVVYLQTDRRHQAFDRHVEQPATEGATLELTLDLSLQHDVERELRNGIEANHATGGSAIVFNHWTGEVLSLANYPTFNPNAYGKSSPAERRNRAVQDSYEPGSIFKIVTAAAALEQRVVTPGELIDTGDGRIRIGGHTIQDTHRNGTLAFADVFAKSSNVGTIKVALELGPERLIGYARRFGFGRRTWEFGPADRMRQRPRDFAGESKGKVWNAADLREGEFASVSIGYQIGVTALQMAAAVGSIANGGELVQPRILRAIVEGGQRRLVPKTVVNRTVSPEIAATVATLMERVVERGTATTARIPGYTVAAKTGTASKWGNGAYSESDHNASMVGFVPARNPAYTIVVVIDSPSGPNGHFGGTVSGPVFKKIAEAALRYGAIPPTIDAPPPLVVRREPEGVHEMPASGPIRPLPSAVPIATARDTGVVPDFTGMSGRDVTRILTRLGIQPLVTGHGLVVGQRPPAGSDIEPGTKATIWLGSQLPHVASSGIREP